MEILNINIDSNQTLSSMDSSNDDIVANEEFNADFEYDRNEIDQYLHFTTQESFLGIKK